MLPSEIRESLRKQPFEPFRLRTTTGQAFDVRHPEFASLTRTSVFVGDIRPGREYPERQVQFALLHVIALEPLNGEEHADADGGGDSSQRT
jgi:hypothetical protein